MLLLIIKKLRVTTDLSTYTCLITDVSTLMFSIVNPDFERLTKGDQNFITNFFVKVLSVL